MCCIKFPNTEIVGRIDQMVDKTNDNQRLQNFHSSTSSGKTKSDNIRSARTEAVLLVVLARGKHVYGQNSNFPGSICGCDIMANCVER